MSFHPDGTYSDWCFVISLCGWVELTWSLDDGEMPVLKRTTFGGVNGENVQAMQCSPLKVAVKHEIYW